MKKVLSFVVAFVLILTISIQGFCAPTASQQSGDGMQISTVVPDDYKIKVTYSEGGYILLNGRICQSGIEITIDRFKGVDLQVICKNDYVVKQIFINGEDVTDDFNNGSLKLRNVIKDIEVKFDFVKQDDSSDTSSKVINMNGYVYLGKNKLSNAEMTFDIDGMKVTTDENGKYNAENITEGRHIIGISKDGKTLATFQIFVERADVADTVVELLPDGTKKITIPQSADTAYVDFTIRDVDDNGEPDVNPDDTDPNLPPDTHPTDDPDNPDDDTIDDGVDAEPGEKVPTEETTEPETAPPVVTEPADTTPNSNQGGGSGHSVLPNLNAMLNKHPYVAPAFMFISLFLVIFLVIFGKKKKNKEEENQENK